MSGQGNKTLARHNSEYLVVRAWSAQTVRDPVARGAAVSWDGANGAVSWAKWQAVLPDETLCANWFPMLFLFLGSL